MITIQFYSHLLPQSDNPSLNEMMKTSAKCIKQARFVAKLFRGRTEYIGPAESSYQPDDAVIIPEIRQESVDSILRNYPHARVVDTPAWILK